MASISEWDKLLEGKYKFFDIEKAIYSENRNRANSPDMFAKFIVDRLRPGDVPDNLLKLYKEAVYGTDAKVKKCIIKHVYAIGNKVWSVFYDFYFAIILLLAQKSSIV